jgi:putative tricarboxylic transport membrane protein
MAGSIRITRGLQAFVIALLLNVSGLAVAMDKVHFLIPGGAGGGWDTTARGVGESLAKSKLVRVSSYQNLSGGGGGKAIAHLIETAERQEDTLMISSTPIILRSLKNIFPQSWRDLTPVASVIVDYGALVVATDSKYSTWQDIVERFQEDPRSINIAGGSAAGSMDHLVAALAFKQSGGDPLAVKYIPYNAGGHAMVGLLSGECQLLSTGLSEALSLAEQGEVRILAMTAAERLPQLPEIPTLVEQGSDAVFINWRGFFGPPGLSRTKMIEYQNLFPAMYRTTEWQNISDARGWTEDFLYGSDFVTFLEEQEQQLKALMQDLGL